MKTPDILIPALRQYQHNNCTGLITGFDHDQTVKAVELLTKKIDALQDFAIWMTGCGYDFCQHEHFCKQRDELLKDCSCADSYAIDET